MKKRRRGSRTLAYSRWANWLIYNLIRISAGRLRRVRACGWVFGLGIINNSNRALGVRELPYLPSSHPCPFARSIAAYPLSYKGSGYRNRHPQLPQRTKLSGAAARRRRCWMRVSLVIRAVMKRTDGGG